MKLYSEKKKSYSVVYRALACAREWLLVLAEIACASLVPGPNAVICGLGTRLPVHIRT